MTVISSPLRYPGGKSKLFPFFADLITKNNLYGGHYREPYAGGAGLALNLLASGFVSHIHLNDLDPAIYSFWHAALHQNAAFCDLIASTPITIGEWHKQKNIWRDLRSRSTLELGFATYFLNRTNRSGIIEGAGPVGGYKQEGDLKLDARFDKISSIRRIRQLNGLKDGITLTNLDALVYLRSHIDSDDLIYLDPPYYVKGQRLYKNFYCHEDHREIAELVQNSGGRWIVSYDDVSEIRTLYHHSKALQLTLRYTAAKSSEGREVVFVSPRLDVEMGVLKVA